MGEIKSGDVVCLKSGSPYMTVQNVESGSAYCWHVNPNDYAIIKRASFAFPLEVLRKVDSPTQRDIDANCTMVLNAVTLTPSTKV